eukprot:UN26608
MMDSLKKVIETMKTSMSFEVEVLSNLDYLDVMTYYKYADLGLFLSYWDGYNNVPAIM